MGAVYQVEDTNLKREVAIKVLPEQVTQDADGNPIEGFSLDDSDPLSGNNVASPVSWKGSQEVSSLAGRELRLHFKLRNCKLYALQFVQ